MRNIDVLNKQREILEEIDKLVVKKNKKILENTMNLITLIDRKDNEN